MTELSDFAPPAESSDLLSPVQEPNESLDIALSFRSGGGPRHVLRKAVETLAIVPTKDRISLLARKIYDVMMYIAQEQGTEVQIYRARLQDVITELEFNSRNTEILKEHLRQMVTTKVEWQSPTKGEGARWSVAALIAHADLVYVSGEVVMEWSYAPTIKQAILDPQRFARIARRYQNAIKSNPAYVLYGICSRYADNPGKVTARQHWTWWRPVLTGMPETQAGIYVEWKYFKRDILKTAVAEVNALTDLVIEIIEHRQGRSMGDLQFGVKRKSERPPGPISARTPVSLLDLGRAIQAGVPQEKADRLITKFGEKAFGVAVTALEARVKRKDLDPVRSPEKFLATVITNAKVEEKPVRQTEDSKRDDMAVKVALIERYREFKRGEAELNFNESPEGDQKSCIRQFELQVLPTAAGVDKAYRTKGLKSPMVRGCFLKFLAEQQFGVQWHMPTDTELLEYSLRG